MGTTTLRCFYSKESALGSTPTVVGHETSTCNVFEAEGQTSSCFQCPNVIWYPPQNNIARVLWFRERTISRELSSIDKRRRTLNFLYRSIFHKMSWICPNLPIKITLGSLNLMRMNSGARHATLSSSIWTMALSDPKLVESARRAHKCVLRPCSMRPQAS